MSQKRIYTAAAAAVAAAVTFGLGVAVGQQSAPTETKEVKVSPPTALDLGQQELDGVDGRQLRLRTVTIEPGGVVGVHSHKGRPGVAYVVSGTLTEHVGDDARQHQPGESWTEEKNTTHWAENKGSSPVVILAVDVFKP
ncbi:MAG: cupin domain-containing protein [Betaproteobacteria bacterium]